MSKSINNRLNVLLGSGVSIPAGLPSVGALTEKILTAENFMRHTDEYYYEKTSHNPSSEKIKRRATELVKCIHINTGEYFDSKFNRKPNYEDIYFILSQIKDEQEGELDNPVIAKFIEGLPASERRRIKLSVGEACNYIIDVVSMYLRNDNINSDIVGNLLDPLFKYSNVRLFTLNHDKVVEKYLYDKNIKYIDGFNYTSYDIGYWNPELFECNDVLHFYKLHGSVDWYEVRADNGDFYDEKVYNIRNLDRWHLTLPDGRSASALGRRSRILCGTFNKISSYSDEVFVDLHSHFASSLRMSNCLLICGYGFGDKAINSRIINWFYSNKANRLIIVHRDPCELMRMARSAARRLLEDKANQKSIEYIKCWVEQIDSNILSEKLKSIQSV